MGLGSATSRSGVPLATCLLAIAFSWSAGSAGKAGALRVQAAPTDCNEQYLRLKPELIGPRVVVPAGALGNTIPGPNPIWDARVDVLAEPSSVKMTTQIHPDKQHPKDEQVFSRVVHRATHPVEGKTAETPKKVRLRHAFDGGIEYLDEGGGQSQLWGTVTTELRLQIAQGTPAQAASDPGRNFILVLFKFIPKKGLPGLDKTVVTDPLIEIPKCIPFTGSAETQTTSEWSRVKGSRGVKITMTHTALEIVEE